MRKASSSPRFPGCPSTIPEIVRAAWPRQAGRGPLEAHHVIDVEIARGEPPFVAERAVDDAHGIRQGEAVRAHRRRHLRGLQEAAPVMGPRLQPAQQIFGPENGEGEGFRRPVEGRDDEQPAGRHQRRGRGHEAGAHRRHARRSPWRGRSRSGRRSRPAPRRSPAGSRSRARSPRHGGAPRRCSSPPHRCRSPRRPCAPEAPRAARRRSRYPPGRARPAAGASGPPARSGRRPGRGYRPRRTGFSRCSGRNFPAGSHQPSARAENFAISAGSTEAGERRVNGGIGGSGSAGHGAQSTFAGLA